MTVAASALTASPAPVGAHPPPSLLHLPPWIDPTPRDRATEGRTDLRRPWHAIRARFGKEIDVATALAASPFDLPVYCPRYPAVVTRHRRSVTLTVPYLSTYLFARWDAADPYLWHALRAVPHLLGFVGDPVQPDPVPDLHLDALRDLIGDDGERAASLLRPRADRFPVGTLVVVNRGPFAALLAPVTAVLDDFFVTLRISGVLGRDHEVKMPAEWCDRLESGSGAPLATTARSGPPTRLSAARRSRRRRGERPS